MQLEVSASFQHGELEWSCFNKKEHRDTFGKDIAIALDLQGYASLPFPPGLHGFQMKAVHAPQFACFDVKAPPHYINN